MQSEVEFTSNSVAAYTEGRKITIPDYHRPVQFAIYLGHELGHVLKNARKFRRQRILSPAEFFETKLDLPAPQKRWYAELFLTNEAGSGIWQPEVIDLVYKTVTLITRKQFNPFDQLAVDLQLISDREQFMANTTYVNFAASGISNMGDKRIAVATAMGHSSEVPAYYTQFGVGIILENTLSDNSVGPVGVSLGEPTFPSHKAAYNTVEKLVEEDLFPTAKVIHHAWQSHLKSA